MTDTLPRCVAGGDFAFVNDSAALVFTSQHPFGSGDSEFVYALESETIWKPGAKPLRPSVVFREAMVEIEAQGAESLCCDNHYWATVVEVTETHNVDLVPFPSDADAIAKAFVRVRVLLGARAIDLRNASDRLIDELKETMGKPLKSGVVSISHPRRGHAHGDLARAFVASIYALEKSATRGFGEEQEMTGGARRMARRGRHAPAADGLMRMLPPRWDGDRRVLGSK